MRPLSTVIFEALVIGILNLVIFTTVKKLGGALDTQCTLIAAGALIHLLFEFSPVGNLNLWWCRSTFPCKR